MKGEVSVHQAAQGTRGSVKEQWEGIESYEDGLLDEKRHVYDRDVQKEKATTKKEARIKARHEANDIRASVGGWGGGTS